MDEDLENHDQRIRDMTTSEQRDFINRNGNTLLRSIFFDQHRVSNTARVMAFHPLFLKKFSETEKFILQSVVLPSYCATYSIAYAAAHICKCDYLKDLLREKHDTVCENKCLERDEENFPESLRPLLDINSILAFDPASLTKEECLNALEQMPGFGKRALVFSVIIMAHFHALSSFVFSVGIERELDHIVASAFSRGNNNSLSSPTNEDKGSLSPPCVVRETIPVDVTTPTFRSDSGDRRGVSAGQWQLGQSLLRTFDPAVSKYISEEFSTIENLTYFTKGSEEHTDTSVYRQSVSNCAMSHCGFLADDFDQTLKKSTQVSCHFNLMLLLNHNITLMRITHIISGISQKSCPKSQLDYKRRFCEVGTKPECF
eukprot:m.151286 g.151286  ORF g.151286 m.151286 type:complete len:372 (+) comp13291_c5_seq8:1755-2870(+)